MTQYVLQTITATKRLIKCYTVTEEDPIRTKIPADRTQHVITDTKEYNDIVAYYDEHTTKAKFTWDGSKYTWSLT